MLVLAPIVLAVLGQDPGALEGIVWEAPPECPNLRAIQEGTAYYLGVEGIEAPRQDLKAHAVVNAHDDGFHLKLELSSPTSLDESEADAPSCEVLVDIVALKLALALDPATVVEEIERAKVEPTSEPEPAPEPTAEPATPTRVRGWSFEAEGIGGIGVLSRFDYGAAARGTLAGELFELRLDATYLGTPPTPIDTEPGASFSMLGFGGTLEGCVAPTAGRSAFPVCLGARALAIRARGQGLESNATSWRSNLSVLVGPTFVWPREASVALTLGARAAIPLLRPAFVVESSGYRFTATRIAGQLSVGLRVRASR